MNHRTSAKIQIRNSNECQTLTPDEYVFLDDLGTDNYTCTGLTYDSTDDTFWIADHGSDTDDPMRIIEYDNTLEKVIQIISIDNLTVADGSLQGLAYDSQKDALWIATGDYVLLLSKKGTILKQITSPIFKHYKANGLCMDDDNSTLWVLCYSKYLLRMDREGNIIEKHKCNYKDQDQIYMYNGTIYITVGADYNGEDNYCILYDSQSKQFRIGYQLTGSYAVEGIFVNDDQIYVVNDGLYHDAKIRKSYISIYDKQY